MKFSSLARILPVLAVSMFALCFSQSALANGFFSIQVLPAQPPVYYAPPPPPVYYAPPPGYYAPPPPPIYVQPNPFYAQQQAQAEANAQAAQEEEEIQAQQNAQIQQRGYGNGYPPNAYANEYENGNPPGFSCVTGPHFCPLRTYHEVNTPCTCPVNGMVVGGIVN